MENPDVSKWQVSPESEEPEQDEHVRGVQKTKAVKIQAEKPCSNEDTISLYSSVELHSSTMPCDEEPRAVQGLVQHVPSTPPLNQRPGIHEVQVPDTMFINHPSNTGPLEGNAGDIKYEGKILNNSDLVVGKDSCHVDMLEKKDTSLKESSVNNSKPKILQTAYLSEYDVPSTESTSVQITDIKSTSSYTHTTSSINVHDDTEVKQNSRQTISNMLLNSECRHSVGIGNSSEYVYPQLAITNTNDMGNVPTYLSSPQAHPSSIPIQLNPGTSISTMFGYSQLYHNALQYMVVMSSTFNTSITVPIYGSLFPIYLDSSKRVGSSSTTTNIASNTEQYNIQCPHWPMYNPMSSTSVTPITSLVTSVLRSKSPSQTTPSHDTSTNPTTLLGTCTSAPSTLDVSLYNTTQPSVCNVITSNAILASCSVGDGGNSALAFNSSIASNNHIFKTPQKLLANKDTKGHHIAITQPKNSTIIRVSPRYSDTKGRCPPVVLVSKNVAPLQPIRGNVHQYVITQGHDKHLSRQHPANEAKRSENQPIYLKGIPPQGYKRRLLSSEKPKHNRSKKDPVIKSPTLKTTSEAYHEIKQCLPSPEQTPDTPVNQNSELDLGLQTPYVLPNVKESIHSEQTSHEKMQLDHLQTIQQTIASERTAAEGENKVKKVKNASKEHPRQKTPRVEDKDRKRERDHRNCVELRRGFQQLCLLLPGSQRSWSRLQILNYTIKYVEETIEKLKGYGVSRFDVYTEKKSEQTQDLPTVECLQSSENLSEGCLINVSRFITKDSGIKRQWIKLSDITKSINVDGNPVMEENPVEESQVYIIEVPNDLEGSYVLNDALIMSEVSGQDCLPSSASQVDVVEQFCPEDRENVIHTCHGELLELHNQLVPESHHNQVEDNDRTLMNTENLSYVSPYLHSSSPDYSPVLSQNTDVAQLGNLLSSPVIILPQDSHIDEDDNDHSFPDINTLNMSPFIVPSFPGEVSQMLKGITNHVSTEDFGQSSNSQDNITPCGMTSDDPLSYVSPFATPKLGFSPTFAELSPGQIVSDNESFHEESPIQKVPLNTLYKVTDFSEVGLTSIAASIEVNSVPESKVTKTKRKSKKICHEDCESPVSNQPPARKKYSHKRSKTNCKSKEAIGNTVSNYIFKDQNTFKTPSPTNTCSKFKRIKNGAPDEIRTKKSRKEPKTKKSECKRQIIST